jgi:mitotic spindle assembly checkpoint protein MAD1
VSGLREQVIDLEEEKSSLSLLTANSISSHESQFATLTRQVSALTSALHESQHLADSQAEFILSLRSQNEELSSRQGRALSVGDENEGESWSVVRDELYRQSAYLHQLELTNANQTTELQELRERRAKVGVLEEEKRSLEIKLSMLEGFKDKCIRAEAELEAGRKERKEW